MPWCLWVAVLLAMLSATCGETDDTDAPRCGCPSHLDSNHCRSPLVLFMVQAEPESDHRQTEEALTAWHKAVGDTVTVVHLVSRLEDGTWARRQRLPCLCVSATVDHRVYFNAAVQAAQTACGPNRAGTVALLRSPAALQGSGRQLHNALEMLSAFGRAQRQPRVALPFRAFRRIRGHNAPGWLAVSGPRSDDSKLSRDPYLWLWNTFAGEAVPLADVPVPPFPGATPAADAWLMAAAVSTGLRHVVDISAVLPLTSLPRRSLSKETRDASMRLLFQPSTSLSYNASVTYPVAFGTPWEAPWHAAVCRQGGRDAPCLKPRVARLNFDGSADSLPRILLRSRCSSDAILTGNCARAAEMTMQWSRKVARAHALPASGPSTASDDQLRALLRRRASPDGVVMLTTSTIGYLDFVLNFACNLEKLQLPHYVIAALDAPMYEAGVRRSLPVFPWFAKVAVPSGPLRFGNGVYRLLCRLRIFVIHRILQLGYALFVIDSDVVLFRNPLPLVNPSLRDVMYAQSDVPYSHLLPLEQTTAEMTGPRPADTFNAGLFFVPASPASIAAFEWMIAEVDAGRVTTDDQPLYNRAFCAAPHGRRNATTCHFTAPASTASLEVRFWPQMMAANGAVDIQRRGFFSFAYRGLRPVLPGQMSLHNNCIKSLANKLTRQKKAGLWWLDEEGICLV